MVRSKWCLMALLAVVLFSGVYWSWRRDGRGPERVTRSQEDDSTARNWPLEAIEALSFDETLTLLAGEAKNATQEPTSSVASLAESMRRIEKVEQRLRSLHEENLKRIDAGAEYYESHSDYAAERYAAFRAEYERRYSVFTSSLEELKNGAPDAGEEMVRILRESGAWQPPRVVPAADRLPTQRLRTNHLEPRTTPEEWRARKRVGMTVDHEAPAWMNELLGAKAAHAQGSDEDLGETLEVEFQDPESAVQALLADEELQGNPAKIVQWVRENIEFVPIWGALQSANTCIATRQGTAMDIASLTIALLRASGVHAKYQAGTVRMPIELAKNWLGNFESADAAASLLASGGIGAAVQVDPAGTPVALRFEHVWVRAFVDFVPTMGACHVEGDTWLDIDTSIMRFDYLEPLAPTEQIPWQEPGEAITPEEAALRFVDGITADANVDPDCNTIGDADYDLMDQVFGPLSQDRVEAVLAEVDDSLSLKEILGAGRVRTSASPSLSPLPAFQILLRGWERSELTDADRFHVNLRVEAAGVAKIDYTLPAPAVGSARFSVNFSPATKEDGAIIWDQLHVPDDPSVEPMFDNVFVAGVNVVPELWRDGEALDLGPTPAVAMGTPLDVVVDYIEPVLDTAPIRASIAAGELTSIGLNLTEVPTPLMDRLSAEFDEFHDKVTSADPDFDPVVLLEAVLSAAVHSWFREVDQMNTVSSLAMGCVTHRYPSAGVCVAKWNAGSTFGLPLSIDHRGLTVDIPGDVVILLSRDADLARIFYTSVFQGLVGSALESQIPASLFFNDVEQEHWLATSDSISLAGRLGDEVVLITNSNQDCVIDSKLSLAPPEVEEIRSALDRGFVVLAHTSPLAAQDSTQAGFAVFDPATGSGVFRMSSGSNGGNRAKCIADENPILPPAADRLIRLWGGSYNESQGAQDATLVGQAALDIIGLAGAGNAGGAVSALKLFNSIQSVLSSYAKNAQFYDAAVADLGEGAKPLAGLVVLLTGLEIINQIMGAIAPPPIDTIVGITGGAMVAGVANAAWTGVRNIIKYQARIAAADAGIVIPGDCLDTLFDKK